MDIITAATILEQQIREFQNILGGIQNISFQITALLQEENSVAQVNPQIKAMCASMNVLITSANSQEVIVQGALDTLSGLVN